MANPTDSLPYPENTRSREENFLGAIAGLNEIPDYPVKTLSRKENYLKYIAEHGGGGGEGEVKSVNGKTGVVVLKADDIEVKNTLSIQDNLERIDEELGRLEDDKQGLLTAGSNITIENNVISATGGGAPTAADLDEVIDGTGDITVDLNDTNDTLLIGTHAKTVEITGVPATATSGTLTEEQLAALLESDKSVLKFNNEIYFLNDNGHEAGIRGYSHSGVENSVFMLKNITVTLNTRGWVLTTQEVSGGGSGPTVVQTIYGDSTSDVPSQAAIYDKMFKSDSPNATNHNVIKIGDGAIARNRDNLDYGNIAIGKNAHIYNGSRNIIINPDTFSSSYDSSIGSQTYTCSGSMIFGHQSHITPTSSTNANDNILVGKSLTLSPSSSQTTKGNVLLWAAPATYTNLQNSVAIGTDSKLTDGDIGVVSFGDPTSTSLYGGTGYRLLTNVHDPVSDHDAATKKYVDDHSGGGGGDVSFTDLFTDGNAQTQVKIGNGSVASQTYGVAIGNRAKAQGAVSVALGASATASGQGSFCFGEGASASGFQAIKIGTQGSASSENSIALGRSATSGYANSVSLGAGSTTSAAGEVSLGGATTGANSWGYNGTSYRKITNVYDGENAHDAATYGQIQALEARIAALEAQLSA